MPQHLVSTILFDGTLSIEWEECLSAPDDRAITLQNLVFNNYKEKNAAGSMLWMFILGLSGRIENEPNNTSIVLAITLNQNTFVLTGDTKKEVWNKIRTDISA